MKPTKSRSIPQKEFGFAVDTFNLVLEWTHDGERIAREREQAERARRLTEAAQVRLFPSKN